MTETGEPQPETQPEPRLNAVAIRVAQANFYTIEGTEALDPVRRREFFDLAAEQLREAADILGDHGEPA